MTAKQINHMKKLDELAEEAGGYVSPLFKENINYDYRKLLAYCREKNIDPLDLKVRDLEKFIVISH